LFRREVAEHVGLLLVLASHHSIRRSKHPGRNLFQAFFRILLVEQASWPVAGVGIFYAAVAVLRLRENKKTIARKPRQVKPQPASKSPKGERS
jgi:hypothetical protein